MPADVKHEIANKNNVTNWKDCGRKKKALDFTFHAFWTGAPHFHFVLGLANCVISATEGLGIKKWTFSTCMVSTWAQWWTLMGTKSSLHCTMAPGILWQHKVCLSLSLKKTLQNGKHQPAPRIVSTALPILSVYAYFYPGMLPYFLIVRKEDIISSKFSSTFKN